MWSCFSCVTEDVFDVWMQSVEDGFVFVLKLG